MSASAPKLQAWGQLKPRSVYIRRSVDAEVEDAIRAGKSCVILGSRQAGKSSLRRRLAESLRMSGFLVCSIDLQGLSNASDEEPEPVAEPDSASQRPRAWRPAQIDWYRQLFSVLWEQLADPSTHSQNQESEEQLVDFLRQHSDREPGETLGALLVHFWRQTTPQQRLVLLFDEVETALARHGFFAGLREAYDETLQLDPKRPLNMALFGVFATSGRLLSPVLQRVLRIPDLYRFRLPPFTRSELDSFIPALRTPPANPGELLDEVYGWTHGQPYLTHRTLYELNRAPDLHIATASLSVEDAVTELYLQPGRVDDDFLAIARQNIPKALEKDETRIQTIALLFLYRRLLENHDGTPIVSDDSLQEQLLNLGMCRIEGSRLCVSNRVVARVLGWAWLNRLPIPDYLARFHAWQASSPNPKKRDVSKHLAGAELEDGIELRDWFIEAIEQGEREDFRQYIAEAQKEVSVASVLDKYQTAVFVLFFALIVLVTILGSVNVLLSANYNALKIKYDNLELSAARLMSEIEQLKSDVTTKNTTINKQKDKLNQLEEQLEENRKDLESQRILIENIKVDTRKYNDLTQKLRISMEKRKILNDEVRKLKEQLDKIEMDQLEKAQFDSKTTPRPTDKTTSGPTFSVTTISPGRDNKWTYYGTGNGDIVAYDIIARQVNRSYRPHQAEVLTIASSGSENRLVSGDKEGKICVTDLTLKKGPFHICKDGHRKGTLSVGFFQNDKFILSTGEDGFVRLWSNKLDEVSITRSAKNAAAASAVSGDGNWAIVGSADRTARIYDIRNPKQPILRHNLPGHSSWISYVWLNRNGTRALVATPGGTVSSWTLDTTTPYHIDNTELLQKFQKFQKLTKNERAEQLKGIVSDIISTENGYYSISIYKKTDKAWVWETFSGAKIIDLSNGPDLNYRSNAAAGTQNNPIQPEQKRIGVKSAKFTPDARYVVTGSTDGKVRVYLLSGRRNKEETAEP